MTAIGIDLGDKRCGIALEIEKIAIPKEIVLRVDLIKFIKDYILKYRDIDTIVVGLPYDLYGIDNKQLNKTKEFIRELERKFAGYKIVGVDERFSSFEADKVLDLYKRKDKIGKRDDLSASFILQSYLDN